MIEVVRETKDTPAQVEEAITRAGGWNRFGEANFRVVWGWTRLDWIGGKWTDYDANGNEVRQVIQLRREPKYFPHDRWHVERWLPPEMYGSPEQWWDKTIEREDGREVATLGPYPSRGDYEHSFTLQGQKGEFLPLCPEVCRTVVRAIEWCRGTTAAEKRGALIAREERMEQEADREIGNILGM